jgi:hypothetical protein
MANTKWEYGFYETPWALQAQDRINEMGADGWECYAVTQLHCLENFTVFWFKRPIEEKHNG